jgi:hypothetical protein
MITTKVTAQLNKMEEEQKTIVLKGSTPTKDSFHEDM